MAQVAGILDAYWLGQQLDIKPGGSFTMGGLVNTAVVYGRQVGRAQKMIPSTAEMKAIVKRGDSFTARYGADLEGELQLHLDTGQTVVIENAFRTDGLAVTVGEATEIDLKFSGGIATEV